MDREGQLDDAEIGPDVPSGARDLPDEKLADLAGELGQLGIRASVEVTRTSDGFEQTHVAHDTRRC